METTQTQQTILNSAIPGFSNLSASGSGIVKNLMGGLPSAGPAQRANAYFGAASGMPGSDFIRNRGFDLYGQQAEQYKQRGFDDFLKLLSGYSGTVAPTVGESIQEDQFPTQTETARYGTNTSAQMGSSSRALARRNQPWETGAGQHFNSFGQLTKDGYYEENTLGISPLFGRGSGSWRVK